MSGKRPTAEVPPVILPEATIIPKDLGRTLLWLAGVVILILGGWVSWNLISDHNKTAEKEHDAAFVKKEKMEQHEREDVQALGKLTEAINLLAMNADQGRQFLLASNKDIKASVAELIARQCRKDNPKTATDACRTEEKVAGDAASDAKEQARTAQAGVGATQKMQLQMMQIQQPPATLTKEK